MQSIILASIILKLDGYEILWLIIIYKNEFILIQKILVIINSLGVLILRYKINYYNFFNCTY